MRLQRALGLVAFGACLVTSIDARANATAYPEAGYARPKSEAIIITWDSASKVQHLDLSLTFEGDATTLLYIVPTPSQPVVERPAMAAVDGAWSLTKKAPEPVRDVAPLPRAAVASFAFESQKFETTEALATWIREHGYAAAAESGIADWAESYVRRGSVFNLIRVTEGTAGRREIVLVPIRLSFRSEAPFVPYFEPEPDFTAHTAYLERSGVCKAGAPCAAPWERELQVLVVAEGPVRLVTAKASAESMLLTQALEVPSASLPPLGSASFPFDAKRQARWTLTRFSDTSTTRAAVDDLRFEPLNGGVVAAAATRRLPSYGAQTPPPRKNKTRALFVALAVGLLVAVGFALRDAESKA